MSSSDSEEDLSAFASVAVDSAFIQKQAKESTKRRAKRKATDNGEEEKPQPVLASVAAVLDARLANELEFEDRGDDSHATDTAPTTQHNDGKQHHTKCKNKRRVKESSNGYTSTAVEQGKKDKKKKKKKRGEEEVTGNQKKIKKKKKDSVNGREVDKAGRNGSKRRQGAGGQDISPSADVCAVRLFRQVPKGVPCRLDVVNRPGADAHGVARDVPTSVPVRLGTGTHAKGTRGMAPSSSDSDSSDDDKRLLAVVVDAQHIYTSAEHAAKEAAAHISNELIDGVE